ncbi:hypothetical protein [Alienimonas chondri]|uniref:Uncharacterized protein n=1 Tax=Alienimonas chondri TaxID=2681879 RepID=A0ABX1VIZ1_9PLAN|nr:hypothetical protein [Alienimonas chondri]NNJ28107.1 hypothetical protein [Alienimonas chondri]
MADDPWADDSRDRDRDDFARNDDFARDDFGDADDGPHADLGTYASDREVEAPNPKKGVGTAVKVIVGLLVGGGLLALLCCGGLFWELSASGFTNPDVTPAGVRAKTDEMLVIDIPDDFTPEISMGGEMPFARWMGDFRMDLAAYGVPGGGQLMLMKLRIPNEGGDRQQMEAQMRQSMDQNSNNNGVRVDVTTTETRTLTTADGRDVEWQFSEGTGRSQQGADLGAYHEIKGTFADGTDVYILQLMIADDEYDEAEIVSMLESIELVDPQTEPVPAGKEPVLEEAPVTDGDAAESDVVEGDAVEGDSVEDDAAELTNDGPGE